MIWDDFLNNFISVASGFLLFYLGRCWERSTKTKEIDNLIAEIKSCYKMMDTHWKWINYYSDQIVWAFDHLSKKNQKLFSEEFQEKKDNFEKTTKNYQKIIGEKK